MQHGPAMHMVMPQKKAAYQVALRGKRQIAEATYAFTFEKPEGLRFSAGQHVRMTLIDPPETDADGNSRFFTIASTPQEPDLVVAMRMRDSAFKRVLGRMRAGEKVLIEMLLECPHGSFVLHEDASRPAVFIVGGIGIVPAYSMIKDAIQRGLPHRMFLFYSNRRPEDAPFLAELQNLAEHNPSFTLIATMTEPDKSAQSWQGETGSINRAMVEKYVGELNSPMYYVAGLPEMVGAIQTVLAEVGASKDNIRAEEFAGFETGHNEGAFPSGGKRHLRVVAILLAIVVLVMLHVGAGASIYRAWLGAFPLHNPLAYVLVVLLLTLVAFKVSLILRLKHSLRSKQGKAGSHMGGHR